MPVDILPPVVTTRRIPRGRLLAALIFGFATPVAAQSVASGAAPRGSELTLSAGPAAGSLRYLRGVARSVELGVELNGGPVYGVVVSDDGLGEIREWVSLFPALALRPAPGVRVFLSPVGLTGITGNDFGSIYPSAQAGLDFDIGRVRLTTTLRVLRVAGGNGSGDYLVQWLPVRIGYAFVW